MGRQCRPIAAVISLRIAFLHSCIPSAALGSCRHTALRYALIPHWPGYNKTHLRRGSFRGAGICSALITVAGFSL
jgi:hypothetical protein